MMQESLKGWKRATRDLPWGLQGAVYDTLMLAKEGKVTLVYGADYSDGRPCLFNAIRSMSTQLSETPSSYAPEVVRYFDEINSRLLTLKVNVEDKRVSPLAAEILLRYFGERHAAPTKEMRERYEMERMNFILNCTPYVEPTDEELITEWLLAISPSESDHADTRPS